MTKVKAISDVEIRIGDPAVHDGNRKGIIYPGFDIEVIEKIEGQEINGNRIWYKDRNGDFYWSGGFEKPESNDFITTLISNLPDLLTRNFDLTTNSLKAPINYFQLLDINERFKDPLTNDFLVAIIDTPVNTNLPGLRSFFDSPSVFSNLKVDHGTFMAGLIGGDDKNGITGVAPHVKMLEVPAIDNFGHTKEDLLVKGIKSLIELSYSKTLIINVSMNIRPEGRVKQYMDILCEKCIVVAAAGEDSELESLDSYQYPASNPNSISVGKYSKPYFDSGKYSNIISEVDVLVPEFNFVSYSRSTDQLKYMSNFGDSCSCAIVTGAIAWLLSSKTCKPDVLSVKSKIKELCFPITDKDNFRNLRLILPK